MPKALLDPIAVGDQRPISVLVVPSDNGRIISATYSIVRRKDPAGTVWAPGGICTITPATEGTYVATPVLITFPTVDQYTVLFSLTWDDGQVTNDVSAVVPVNPLVN